MLYKACAVTRIVAGRSSEMTEAARAARGAGGDREAGRAIHVPTLDHRRAQFAWRHSDSDIGCTSCSTGAHRLDRAGADGAATVRGIDCRAQRQDLLHGWLP